jgi:hypothetical protein
VLAFALLGFFLETAASAAERFEGRWAADAGACGPDRPAAALLVVEALSLRWRQAACAVRRSYRVRDAWHIDARCLENGLASDVPIKLELHGKRLVVSWPPAPAQVLNPCPPVPSRRDSSENRSDERGR